MGIPNVPNVIPPRHPPLKLNIYIPLPSLSAFDISGWMHMGRTIGLKLNEKEERIINQLNKQGVINSDLLRSALWQYFNTEHEILPASTQKPEPPTINHHTLTHEDLLSLKKELHQFTQQNTTFFRYIDEKLTNLHHMIEQLNNDFEHLQHNHHENQLETTMDIHEKIDELIKHKIL
jgi:hypothetical protein